MLKVAVMHFFIVLLGCIHFKLEETHLGSFVYYTLYIFFFSILSDYGSERRLC